MGHKFITSNLKFINTNLQLILGQYERSSGTEICKNRMKGKGWEE